VLDAIVAADMITMAVRGDDGGHFGKVEVEIGEYPPGRFKIRDITGVDQCRRITAVDKMVGIQLPPLYEKEIFRYFQLGDVHFTESQVIQSLPPALQRPVVPCQVIIPWCRLQ